MVSVRSSQSTSTEKGATAVIIFLFNMLACYAQNWQGVGPGFDHAVRSLYSDTVTNTLIAGGNFKFAGNKMVNGYARWDGAMWDSLGSGQSDCQGFCNPNIAITRYRNHIYTSIINEAGGIPVKGIARWDGISWDSVGTGLTYDSTGQYATSIWSLTVINNKLMAGGRIRNAGGVLVNGVAVWNDTTWATFATPLPLNPFDSTAINIKYPTWYNNELYFAGAFRDTNLTVVNIGRWDGSQWKQVGNGIRGQLAGISDLVIYNNELYAGGLFTTTDGNPGDAIARWDGTSWHDVGGGLVDSLGYPAQIIDMEVFHNELYVVGVFSFAGGVPAKNIAKWNGSEWCGLGNHFDNKINAVVVHNNELYIGGGFKVIDNDTVNGIAKWIGGSFADTCGNTSGAEEIIAPYKFAVYPNPAEEELTISFTAPAKGEGKIAVMNTLGQRVYEHQLDKCIGKCSQKVNISELPGGVYFIQLAFADGTITRKFIKQ